MPQKLVIDDKKLRQIIDNVVSEKTKVHLIHDGVEYGIFQEFSTASGGRQRPGGRGRTGKGHPSLIPAFEIVIRDIPDAIGQAIESGHNLDDILAKGAFDMQNKWADDVNVDTGTYKDSITVSTE